MQTTMCRSKTHERLKERFLIGRNRTKRAHFINSTYLVSVGYGRLAEGKGHETDSPGKRARFVLFHPTEKRSFDLVCFGSLPLFSSEHWQSTLFHFCVCVFLVVVVVFMCRPIKGKTTNQVCRHRTVISEVVGKVCLLGCQHFELLAQHPTHGFL